MKNVVYWAWPSAGAGHEMRAAAICRRLAPGVRVVRGAYVQSDWALEHWRVPYIHIGERRKAFEYLASQTDSVIVIDDQPDPELSTIGDVFVWKTGRRRLSRPTIAVAGSESFFPIIGPEPSELLPRAESRRILGIPADVHARVGIRSDSAPGLIQADYLITQRPAMAYLAAADHLVACIGLNLYGEVRWLEEYGGLEVDQTWVAAPNRPDQLDRLVEHDHPIHRDGAQAAADLITELR